MYILYVMFIKNLIKSLNKNQIKYGLVGGYAVALHGVLRGTVDIDLVTDLKEASLIKLEKALNSLGLQSRIPVSAKDISQFRNEYIEKRNLIAWSFVNAKNPLEIVDILITHDWSEFDIVLKHLHDLQISVVSIDDLIELKKEAGRPQDIEDIKSLQLIKKAEKSK